METLLENEGYFGQNVCVLDFEMTTIPLDIDLVTMNCPELFRNVFVENDYEYLELFGRALSRLLSKFGMSWKDVISKLILGDASRVSCLRNLLFIFNFLVLLFFILMLLRIAIFTIALSSLNIK